MMFAGSSKLGVEEHAIYLPAISSIYAAFALNGSFSRPLPIAARQLDFLRPQLGTRLPDGTTVPWPDQPLFHYRYALYSAGQAAKTEGGAEQESIVSKRDRNRTLVLGDSGGYQVQTDTIKFAGEQTLERMLRWMERNADYSMVLDFPTAGISTGVMEPHRERLLAEGYDLEAMGRDNGQELDFNACLMQTMLNNAYFVRNQSGKTKFLNVLQGRNEAESAAWYDAVKDYPFENWAFAGSNQSHLSTVLRRLFDMQRDGILSDMRWLHILGVSSLPLACLFTTLQQCVRKIGHPEFQISFDSAGPFRQAAYNQVVTAYTIDGYGWHIHARNIAKRGTFDDTRLLSEFLSDPLSAAKRKSTRHRARFPADTEIGRRIRVSDLLVDSGGKSAVGVDSVCLMMNHNVEAFLQAHRRAQRLYATGHVLDMTASMLSARNLIEHIFEQEDPYSLIDAGQVVLDRFGARG